MLQKWENPILFQGPEVFSGLDARGIPEKTSPQKGKIIETHIFHT